MSDHRGGLPQIDASTTFKYMRIDKQEMGILGVEAPVLKGTAHDGHGCSFVLVGRKTPTRVTAFPFQRLYRAQNIRDVKPGFHYPS